MNNITGVKVLATFRVIKPIVIGDRLLFERESIYLADGNIYDIGGRYLGKGDLFKYQDYISFQDHKINNENEQSTTAVG